jgi:lysozyme family protein
LQRAIARPDIYEDGKIGDKTIAAAAAVQDKKQLLRDFTTFRLKHYSELPHFKVYWKGWIRRVVEVTMDSAIFDDG